MLLIHHNNEKYERSTVGIFPVEFELKMDIILSSELENFFQSNFKAIVFTEESVIICFDVSGGFN